MGSLHSCPNCFSREFQSTTNDQVQGLSETCVNFHTNFIGPGMDEAASMGEEKVQSVERLSKSDVIDSLQKVYKEFLKEVAEDPEKIGYVKTLTSGNIEILLKDVTGGYSMMSIWKCDIPAQKIAEFLMMVDKRKEWDSHVAECKKICDISEGIGLYYTLYKRFLTMAQRDVLVATQQIRLEHAWVNVSTSINSSIIPESDKVVRAKVNKSGYFIQDMPKDVEGNCSIVVSVYDANYGQSVAAAIVKKMTASVAPKYIKMMIEAMRRQETELN